MLDGGAGTDTLIGGAGNDTYVVDAAGDVVTETAGEGTDTVQSAISYTLGANVENLTLTGTAAINAHRQYARQHPHRQRRQQRARRRRRHRHHESAAPATTPTSSTAPATWSPRTPAKAPTRVQSSVSYTLGANVENLTLTGAGTSTAPATRWTTCSPATPATTCSTAAPATTRMIGGRGNDTYVVDAAGDVVTESWRARAPTRCRAAVTYTLGANVENLTLTGTAAINGTGNTLQQHAHRQRRQQRARRRRRRRHDDRRRRQRHLRRRHGRRRRHRDSPAKAPTPCRRSISYTLGANVENLTLTGTATINGTGNTLAQHAHRQRRQQRPRRRRRHRHDGRRRRQRHLRRRRAGDVVTEAAGEGTDTVQSSDQLHARRQRREPAR